ncbi:MAG: hypothetical protein AAF559_11225 [Pseudomonadota bacterium]
MPIKDLSDGLITKFVGHIKVCIANKQCVAPGVEMNWAFKACRIDGVVTARNMLEEDTELLQWLRCNL